MVSIPHRNIRNGVAVQRVSNKWFQSLIGTFVTVCPECMGHREEVSIPHRNIRNEGRERKEGAQLVSIPHRNIRNDNYINPLSNR